MSPFKYLTFRLLTQLASISILFLSSQALAFSPSSIGRPDLSYSKKVLSVCYFNQFDFNLSSTVVTEEEQAFISTNPGDKLFTRFSDSFKALVKNSLEQSFAEQKTGVSFTGFDDCTNVAPSDVVLIFDKRNDSMFEASLLGDPLKYGRKYKKRPSNSILFHRGLFVADKDNRAYQKEMLHAMGLSALDPRVEELSDRVLSMSIVHEFMHVLGFEHEFFQKSGFKWIRKFDLSQNSQASKSLLQDAGDHWQVGDKSADLTDFDIFSTMNYQAQSFLEFALKVEAVCKTKRAKISLAERSQLCNEEMMSLFAFNQPSNHSYLSQGDVAGISKVYLQTNSPNSWSEKNFMALKWLELAKPVIERELNQFRQR